MSVLVPRLSCWLAGAVAAVTAMITGLVVCTGASAHGCVTRGGRVLVHRQHVIIYGTARHATVACKTRTHRRTTLISAGDIGGLIPRSVDITPSRIVYVAIQGSEGTENDLGPASYVYSRPFGYPASSSPAIDVPSISYRPGIDNQPGADSPNEIIAVPQVLALADGYFAWMTCTAPGGSPGRGVPPIVGFNFSKCVDSPSTDRRIYLQSPTEAPSTLLDSSTGSDDPSSIAVGSLSASADGTTLAWTHGGQSRTAAIPGAPATSK